MHCFNINKCSSQSMYVLETGLSDVHLITLTAMRENIEKFKPRITHYRSYKHFLNDFRFLPDKLSEEGTVNNDNCFK